MLLCLLKNSWNLRGHIVKKSLVVLGVVKPTSILQSMLELELTLNGNVLMGTAESGSHLRC